MELNTEEAEGGGVAGGVNQEDEYDEVEGVLVEYE